MSDNHPRPYSDIVYQPVQRDPELEASKPSNGKSRASSPRHSSDDHQDNHEQSRASTHNQQAAESHPVKSATMADDERRIAQHLTRIQVLTPLAILLNIAALAVCSVVIQPGLGAINEMHVTQFTPNGGYIALFWAVLFLFQIGFAMISIAGRKDFTRRTIAYGIGIRLALANLLLGGWAIAWVINTHASFLAGLVLLSLNGIILLVTAILLAIKYPASTSRPFDWLFLHAPVKMFLVITLQLDIPQMLFMALGWDLDRRAPEDGGIPPLPGQPDSDESLYTILKGVDQPSGPKPGTPAAAHLALWPSFGIIAGMGAFSAIWIFAASDFTWAVCGIYLHFALLYSRALPLDKRPPEIVAAIILAMLLQLVAFIGSIVHRAISPAHRDDGEGRIALGRSPQEEAAAARQEAEADAAAAAARERALAHSSRASLASGEHQESGDPSALEHGETGSQGSHAQSYKVSRKLGSKK